MAWSQLTALTSLSCILSHGHEPCPPPVLTCMTSLRKLEIVHPDPDYLVHEDLARDFDLAYQAEILSLGSFYTRRLTRLSSLVIDGHECIRPRADEI